MVEAIAERRLYWSLKGANIRSEFIIKIGTPFVVTPGSVEFSLSEDAGGCTVEFEGFPIAFEETTYGADTVQALQLAADVDPILMRLSDRYDFFFPTGEGYFEE